MDEKKAIFVKKNVQQHYWNLRAAIYHTFLFTVNYL